MPARPRPGRKTAKASIDELAPRDRVVTERQATYLAAESGVSVKSLAGRRISELDDVLHMKIDPISLLFRRVCGRVVKRDGAGVLHAVPNATVHVEDTDCTFLGFAPIESPWWWLWPLSCHREELASVRTDACGNFCVWIPRWDIDRILQFRKRRICYPDLLRPRLRDLLAEVDRLRVPWPPIPPDPNPPDPPYLELGDLDVLAQVAGVAGAGVARRVRSLSAPRSWGAAPSELDELLDTPAFAHPPMAPLTDSSVASLDEHLASAANLKFDKVDPAQLVRTRQPIGAYLRCRDVWLPEWQTIVDVPDITFRVTQDIDFDGDEEVIYSEGYFDVRWNADPIPTTILLAAPWAISTDICDAPDIACQNVPALRSVGVMPLESTHHDMTTGVALRPNRPVYAPGLEPPPAGPGIQHGLSDAPYAGTLQLHGCAHISGAEWYRILHREGGANFQPFTNLHWFAPRLGPGAAIPFDPDPDGWYRIRPESELVFPHWLLNWPTGGFGTTELRVQVADLGKNPLTQSATIPFAIDNRGPDLRISQIRWRAQGGAWLPGNVATWPFSCPIIHRAAGTNLEIEAAWQASAVHFRDAVLTASGCGGGDLVLASAATTMEHWYVDPTTDNAVSRVATYTLDASASAGCYTFSLDGYTRAFNPAGDGGGPGTDWLTNYSYAYGHTGVAVSVVDG